MTSRGKKTPNGLDMSLVNTTRGGAFTSTPSVSEPKPKVREVESRYLQKTSEPNKEVAEVKTKIFSQFVPQKRKENTNLTGVEKKPRVNEPVVSNSVTPKIIEIGEVSLQKQILSQQNIELRNEALMI